MVGCNDKRNNCGTTIASSCVPYTGELSKLIDESKLPCIPNINDITIAITKIIEDLKDYTSLESYDNKCLDDCNCDTKNHLNIIQSITDKLCEINDRLIVVENNNILTTKLNINLSCFNSPCLNNSSNEHTLLDIISLFADELCMLKNK